MSASPKGVERAEVIVVGDGFVALAAALALRGVLGEQAPIVIVAEPQKRGFGHDGRAFAIAPSSLRLLCDLGVWQELEPGLAADQRHRRHGQSASRRGTAEPPVLFRRDCGRRGARPYGRGGGFAERPL